jgi:ABC-type transport system involved in multi-copper enzyme maturation permease subunit
MSALWNVVHAELFKLMRKRRMMVLAGLWWLVLPMLALVVASLIQANLQFVLDEFAAGASVVGAFASPFGLARLAIAGPAFLSPTLYVIAAAAIAAVLIGDERTHQMWKTILTAQHARTTVLAGKLIAAMLALGALMLGGVISGALLGIVGMGFLPTDFGGDWGTLLPLLLLQWLFSAALVAFSFLMIYLTRNLAVGVILIFFLPALIEGLYSIYAVAVGFQPINRFNILLQTLRIRQVLEDLPAYFFSTNLYAPARQQLNTLTEALLPPEAQVGGLSDLLGSSISIERAAIVVSGYALLFAGLMLWRFLRSDVD